MIYNYIFDPVAFDEYNESIIWYAERSETAARNFILEVNKKLETICRDSLSFPNKFSYFRETSLKKYPFCIVFFLDEKEKIVIISSIYHHKRNPKRKYRK